MVITLVEIISTPSSPTDSKTRSKPELSRAGTQHTLNTFRLVLRDSEIPMGVPTTRVYISDGLVTIEDEQVRYTVPPANFMLPTSQWGAGVPAKPTERLSEKSCRAYY